jgi:[CysO sulfur-carrier protein]-S-L-cysteine hydrolase
MKREVTLTESAWNEITRHALECFPEECCGVIIRRGDSDEVQRCKNIQNLKHSQDPINNPRDAKIAYSIDPQELNALLNAAAASGASLKAFYHSHPNHDAYFSAEDKEGATPFGEPTYPETAQIVVSIYDRTVKRVRAYLWSPERKDFVEVPVTTASI